VSFGFTWENCVALSSVMAESPWFDLLHYTLAPFPGDTD
jgi:hypothetical protein